MILSHAFWMGSVHFTAHKTRGISRVLYLSLFFCDSFGASGFIAFCRQPCRGISVAISSIISPAHMRVPAWMMDTAMYPAFSSRRK